jgi:hypothetical protein
MTGAGGLSSSPQPVTETRSTLSLSGRCGGSRRRGCAGDFGAGQGEGLPQPDRVGWYRELGPRHTPAGVLGPQFLDFALRGDVIKPLLQFMIAKKTSPPMTSANAQRVRALDLLKSRGMLRQKDFIAEGIGPETLARLVREAAVVRPARGLYQLPDTPIEAAHMLAEAAVLVPKGVVCLTSALQYHELTLQMPSAVWMAIERTAWRPKIDYPRIRFVRFTGSALTEGVERHRVENIEVPITDPARTIVDCFRYRAKVGLDVAMEGLREGLRRRRCKPDDLWRYARKARVWSVMRPYVEAMAADAT